MAEKANQKKFQKLLLDQKARILNSNLMANREDLEVSTDEMADENDFASAIVNQSVTTNLRDQNVNDLKKIEEALVRLEEGSYFECEECGDEIEERRLQALPTTSLCIACAEQSEHKRKSFA
jgi:DnaK suppressor protein